MLSRQAEPGHAGRLDSLSAANLERLNIRGRGRALIDESCHPPRLTWSLKGQAGSDFRGSDHGEIQEILPAFREFYARATAEHGTGHPVPDTYRARMKFLQDEAAHDGHVMNHASKIDFERFVRSAPDIRRGDLVLMDNGNLRAIWRDGRGTHLGLQFLGGRMVQYVIFKKRENEQSISRVTGRDSLEGLERQFDAFELHSLLYE